MESWDSFSRITLGIMGFILFWYDMLGHIDLSFMSWGVWILMIGGVYLMITGASGTCPIKNYMKK